MWVKPIAFIVGLFASVHELFMVCHICVVCVTTNSNVSVIESVS